MGWPGAAGLLTLVVACALWLASSDTPPQEARREPALTGHETGRLASPEPPPAPWPVATARQQADDLASLLALAGRHQVQWPTADYRLFPAPGAASAPPDTAELVWQIDVPLRGQPAQLEAFVRAVPHELPHARVEQLSLTRAASAPGSLQADARLSLHYRRNQP